MFHSICLSLLICSLALADDSHYEREIRQSPVFFQGAINPQRAQGPGRAPVPKFAAFGGPHPQGFTRAATPVTDDEQEFEENAVAPSPTQPSQQVLHFKQAQQQPLQFRPTPPLVHQQPIASSQNFVPEEFIAKPRLIQEPSRRQPQPIRVGNQIIQQALTEEELEEKEEPDRLTELLPQSKFNCEGKKTGYYADEGLNCEVFHYCQDNAKHSWICPEGFSFHQVHLICMPPSNENICQQSSQYHFVNDFLYRAINMDEVNSRPNVTIRYADRYYPENYYESEGENHGGENVRTFQQRPTVASTQTAPARRPIVPQQFQPTGRPFLSTPQQFTRQPYSNQAFHSPEEINIPLNVRRPSQGLPQRNQQSEAQDFDLERK